MPINITFQLASLPEGFAGTPQEFADLIVERLTAVASGSFLTGQIGGVEPTTNIGLFVDTDNQVIKLWNEDDAEYKVLKTVPIGSGAIWYSGAPPTDWLICDGAAKLRADYPELFAVIGTTWGTTDSTNFLLPKTLGRSPFGIGRADYVDNNDVLAPRTDKGKIISIGEDGYAGHDFVYYTGGVVSAGPDFDPDNRTQTSPSGLGTYINETIPPYFGVNLIIKAR